MDVLNLVLTLLGNLAVLSGDPVLGAKGKAVTSLLTLVQLARGGSEGLKELQKLADQVEAMVKEGRAPTDVEWDALKAQSDEAHAIIQNFKPGE